MIRFRMSTIIKLERQVRHMTLDKAKELLAVQVDMGGGYNRNGAKLILLEVQKEHGHGAVDQLIRELGLEKTFGFRPGESLFA